MVRGSITGDAGQGFNVCNVFYHGTSKDIEGFDKAQLGSLTGAESAKKAIWLSNDPVTAQAYAHHSAVRGPVQKLLNEATKAEEAKNFDLYEQKIIEAENVEASLNAERRAGQNIIPAYVKDDLFEVDMKGRSFDDFGVSDEINEILDSAKRDGRAGVRFDNLDDAVGIYNRPATHVAMFEPSSVRSVNAKFDPSKTDSPNLLASSPVATTGAATIAGLLASIDSPETFAETAARLRAETSTNGAYAPRSETLQDITMGLRGLERSLEGNPASLLFPDSYVQHLEEFNRPYERSTYTGALLGALDFL